MYKIIIKKKNTLLPYLTASDYNVYILVLTQIVILITGSSCASESHWHKKNICLNSPSLKTTGREALVKITARL